MYNILSILFRYLFIFIIYLFIFAIIRLIYLDIKGMSAFKKTQARLKLIGLREQLPFHVDEEYPIDKSITIGRKKGNSIVIGDSFISSKHLKITLKKEHFYIKDLGSSNGTFLNDNLVDVETELKDHDHIKIGQVEFIFVTN